jgi:GcrA cell cycle regulator
VTVWTPDQIGRLRFHASEGLSTHEAAAAINREFGTAFTRNAVIGRAIRSRIQWVRWARAIEAHRNDLERPREKKIPRRRLTARMRKERPVALAIEPAPPVLVLDPTEIPAEQRRTLLQLGNEHCRFPYEEGPALFFCGSPQADFARGVPYCPSHLRIAYRGVPPVGRDRGGGRNNGATVGPDPAPARSERREGHDQRGEAIAARS